ncbi:MAG: hypothetical protein RL003_1118, partial [Bacteroidota bacterium]
HFDQDVIVGIVAALGVTGNDVEDDVAGDVIDEGNDQDQSHSEEHQMEVVARFCARTGFAEPVHQPLGKSRLITHIREDS